MRATIELFVIVFAVLGTTVVVAQEPKDAPESAKTYLTAEEAFAVGAAHRNAKNFAAAEAPLEEALTLSDDVRFRAKTYQALIPSYRLHAEVDDLATAVDYVVKHGVTLNDRSGAANALAAYARERKSIDDVVKRYERRLEEEPNDRAALFVLAEIYGGPKRDAKRQIELLDRYIVLELEGGPPQTVAGQAALAQLYVKAEKYREAAELYEAAARGDEKLAAWHFKEAAGAWLSAGEPAQAVVAARLSSASAPEVRSELLTYFWHRGVADAFLDGSEPIPAIPHYEQAIAVTKIEGYRKASEQRLAEAKRKVASP